MGEIDINPVMQGRKENFLLKVVTDQMIPKGFRQRTIMHEVENNFRVRTNNITKMVPQLKTTEIIISNKTLMTYFPDEVTYPLRDM